MASEWLVPLAGAIVLLWIAVSIIVSLGMGKAIRLGKDHPKPTPPHTSTELGSPPSHDDH